MEDKQTNSLRRTSKADSLLSLHVWPAPQSIQNHFHRKSQEEDATTFMSTSIVQMQQT